MYARSWQDVLYILHIFVHDKDIYLWKFLLFIRNGREFKYHLRGFTAMIIWRLCLAMWWVLEQNKTAH